MNVNVSWATIAFVLCVYIMTASFVMQSGWLSDWGWMSKDDVVEVGDPDVIDEKPGLFAALLSAFRVMFRFIGLIACMLSFQLPIPWYVQLFTIMPLNITFYVAVVALIRGV